MLFTLHFPNPYLVRQPQGIATAATAIATLLALVGWWFWRRRLTPAQREERRRNRLATVGRIIDGTLIDTAPENDRPQAIIYRYRVSGVTYECGQDITTLAEKLPDIGTNSAVFGLPVQVRYDRDNPADSMVVSETWNGLWNQTTQTEPVPEHQGL